MKTIIVTILLVALVGCGKNESNSSESEEEFRISNIWARPGVKNRNTAAFMKITNASSAGDTLYSASSFIADVVEIHETYSKEKDMKGMRRVEKIPVPGNTSVELKPGSYHIMLIGLKEDLESGEQVSLNLFFKKAGKMQITAKVGSN